MLQVYQFIFCTKLSISYNLNTLVLIFKVFMWKLIFIGVLIWFAYHTLKRITHHSDINKSFDNKDDATREEAELMVKCEKCAVHLPRSEALMSTGQFYCSTAHLPKK